MAGFRPARYFLLANSTYLFAAVLNIFTATGMIPYQFYVEPFNIGNSLQVILFSLGLAYRFKVMQFEVKTHKAEKQRMIEQQKEALEIEVKRQTKHIQTQKEEIEVQNEELFQQREEIIAQRDFVEGKNTELAKVNQKLKDNELVLKKANVKLKESQQKVSLKNTELAEVNQKLKDNELVLKESNYKLQESQQKIALKNKELEERDRQIKSSIKAALSIQSAILPYPSVLHRILNNHFVIYRPKDIVSGDFYWVDTIDQYRVIITADCTGHGVPGALMSIIGKTALDKVITIHRNTNPSEILEEIHKEVSLSLKQGETQNNSGMDMSVLVLEDYDKGLTLARFAGAKSSIFFKYPNENQITEVKGTRRAIGGIQNLNKPFQTREIIFKPDTMIYMGSDGFVDQNDINRKKFGGKALKKLLAEISDDELKTQKHKLENKLEEHMHGTQQRDDVLLIGFKL